MSKKEIVDAGLVGGNPNISPATRFGNLVFVSGQVGRHPETGEVGEGIRGQTIIVIERIQAILEAAGTSLDNVMTITAYVTARENLSAYNEEYAKYFKTDKPARTSVIANLGSPDLLVEITATACIPD